MGWETENTERNKKKDRKDDWTGRAEWVGVIEKKCWDVWGGGSCGVEVVDYEKEKKKAGLHMCIVYSIV